MPAHAWLGLAMIVVNLLAGVIGAFAWWRVEPSRLFWPLLRAGQLLVVLVAAHGGILYAQGVEIPDLHLIYGLMPIGIAFIAEQLRLTSAQAVLDQRGLEDSGAVAAVGDCEGLRLHQMRGEAQQQVAFLDALAHDRR